MLLLYPSLHGAPVQDGGTIPQKLGTRISHLHPGILETWAELDGTGYLTWRQTTRDYYLSVLEPCTPPPQTYLQAEEDSDASLCHYPSLGEQLTDRQEQTSHFPTDRLSLL